MGKALCSSCPIVQGAALVGLTAFLVLSQISFLKPEVSKVMAAGSAGTWLTFGYEIYIMVGVIGVAVSSVFYQLASGKTHVISPWDDESEQQKIYK